MKYAKAFCVAAIALGATGAGFFPAIDGAQAATVNISGATPPSPGYGTASTNNNVIDGGLSGVTSGGLGFTSFKGSATGNPAVVTTDLPSYNVDWYYVGSESGFVNTLTAPGINAGGLLLNSPTAGQFNESNQNNNCPGCGHGPNTGPVFLGTSTGQTSSVLSFSFQDGHSANIANGNGNPNAGGSGVASIIFSFVTNPSASTWVLSNDATSAWFLFAFNDGGGPTLISTISSVSHASTARGQMALRVLLGSTLKRLFRQRCHCSRAVSVRLGGLPAVETGKISRQHSVT